MGMFFSSPAAPVPPAVHNSKKNSVSSSAPVSSPEPVSSSDSVSSPEPVSSSDSVSEKSDAEYENEMQEILKRKTPLFKQDTFFAKLVEDITAIMTAQYKSAVAKCVWFKEGTNSDVTMGRLESLFIKLVNGIKFLISKYSSDRRTTYRNEWVKRVGSQYKYFTEVLIKAIKDTTEPTDLSEFLTYIAGEDGWDRITKVLTKKDPKAKYLIGTHKERQLVRHPGTSATKYEMVSVWDRMRTRKHKRMARKMTRKN
jgi:uncharacterized protein YodC (DUF2158 family)